MAQPAFASMATETIKNQTSSGVPVKVWRVFSVLRSEKSPDVLVKFHRLLAAYVRTGGSSSFREISKKGMERQGGMT